MINRFRQRYLTLRYSYDNPIDRQRARLLLLLTLVTFAALAIWFVVLFIPHFLAGDVSILRTAVAVPFAIFFVYLVYRFIQNGRLRAALWLFVIFTLLIAIQQVVLRVQVGPDLTPTATVLLTVPLVAAGILLDRRSTVATAAIIVIAVLIASATQNKPLADFGFVPTYIVQIETPEILLTLGIVLVFLLGFVGALEQTANESMAEIQQRGWVTQFATELTKGGSEEIILSRAVNLINDRLGYLLTRIYLVGEDGSFSRSIRSGMGEQTLMETTRINLSDSSAIAEAGRTMLPVLLTTADLPSRRSYMLASAQTAAALPIVNNGKLLGVLDLQSAGQTAFAENEVAIQILLANEIAIALTYTENVASLQRAVRERETSISRLQSQLQEFRQRDRQSLNEIWGNYIQGRGTAAIGFDLEADSSLSLVAANDLPANIYAALTSGQLQTSTNGKEQVVNVPIVFRNTVLGAMSFTIPNDQALNQHQLEMAQTVAERLALALENTRLFEQSQAQAMRERKASEVASLLIGATDVNALLNMAAEQFNEALGAVHTQIFIQPDILAEPLARTVKEEA